MKEKNFNYNFFTNLNEVPWNFIFELLEWFNVCFLLFFGILSVFFRFFCFWKYSLKMSFFSLSLSKQFFFLFWKDFLVHYKRYLLSKIFTLSILKKILNRQWQFTNKRYRMVNFPQNLNNSFFLNFFIYIFLPSQTYFFPLFVMMEMKLDKMYKIEQ